MDPISIFGLVIEIHGILKAVLAKAKQVYFLKEKCHKFAAKIAEVAVDKRIVFSGGSYGVRAGKSRIIGIHEREADSEDEEEKQNPGAEPTSRYTEELFHPVKNSAKARAEERNSTLLPNTSNPYEQLADINEGEADDEGTEETASRQRAARRSLMGVAFSLDSPRLETEKSPTASPKIQDSQSKEDGQGGSDADSGKGSPGVKSMSSGEMTPRGKRQEGMDMFSEMLNQTVKSPAKWAEANDDDLPMLANRYAKGRPPEDKSHTPDRGNAQKRRGMSEPEYQKVDTFSQLVSETVEMQKEEIRTQEIAQMQPNKEEPPDREEKGERTVIDNAPQVGAGRPPPPPPPEPGEAGRGAPDLENAKLRMEQRVNFDSYTCPSS
ncbi:hypothetical protein R1sor_014952 [Riccia sorocarpa]|uniref:Uncharacterized protein n=1 Tax=Riccia sorocarpa TaxID=122646 RepID=A0ABD3HBB5_9MARC